MNLRAVSALIALLPAAMTAAETWHVAISGDDAAAGSGAKPFRTIQHAAELAGPGDTVVVHAGTYRETVRPKRSGEAGHPITYQPGPGEIVVLSGADPLTGCSVDQGQGQSKGQGTVWKAAMPGDFYHSQINYSDQVFIDGEMLLLARWPNSSLDLSAPTKSLVTAFVSTSRDKTTNWTTGVIEDAKLEPATDGYYVGATIMLQPNANAWSWAFTGEVIAQHGKQLTFRSRNDCGIDGKGESYAVGSRYYLFDKRAMLDSPGEWWHDRTTGQLLLRTPDGSDPSTHVVEARRRDWAFVLDGMSHITIQGFRLFACTITTDLQAGDGVEYDVQGNDRYPWRKGDTLPSAHHITLDGLDCRYPSHFTDISGHFFLQWGLNTGINISGLHQTIQNCRVRGSAGNGIVTYGRENKVLNNLVEDTDYAGVDCAMISTLGGAGAFDCEIANNTGRRSGRSGIILRGFQNSDPAKPLARVHHNDISQFLLQDYDGGATYTFGQDAKFARVDHNWFHDATGATCSGFYIDYSKNWIADHNVIWNVEWAIHLEGAHESGPVNALCYNNTILGSIASIGIGNGIAPGSVVRNNLSNRPFDGKYRDGCKELADNLAWDGKPGSTSDPRLIAPDKRDFRLAAGSPARGAGKALSAIAMQQPGNPDIRVTPPNEVNPDGSVDLGAYAADLPAWTAGSTMQGDGIKPPVVPSDLTATAASASQINLSWADRSSNESGFVIERSESNGAFVQVATAAANAIDYYDMGLTKATAYTYRVRAMNSAGASVPTAAATVTTLAKTISDAAIAFTATRPPLDGTGGPAWDATAAHPITAVIDGTVRNPADCSGSWKALWDDTALYILVEVNDDILAADPKEPWYAADGIEVYLDGDNSKRKTYDGIDDFQVAFPWGTKAPVLGGNSARRSDGVAFTEVKTATGYRVVVALPWRTLSATGKAPLAGALLGFDVHLVDNDGKGWKGKCAWHATANSAWIDPSLFGTVELVKP